MSLQEEMCQQCIGVLRSSKNKIIFCINKVIEIKAALFSLDTHLTNTEAMVDQHNFQHCIVKLNVLVNEMVALRVKLMTTTGDLIRGGTY